MPKLIQTRIITDGGPWAQHNHLCSVCREKHSVLDMSSGVMLPCWGCQKEGWITVKQGYLKQFINRLVK